MTFQWTSSIRSSTNSLITLTQEARWVCGALNTVGSGALVVTHPLRVRTVHVGWRPLRGTVGHFSGGGRCPVVVVDSSCCVVRRGGSSVITVSSRGGIIRLDWAQRLVEPRFWPVVSGCARITKAEWQPDVPARARWSDLRSGRWVGGPAQVVVFPSYWILEVQSKFVGVNGPDATSV